jgi:hypothetical protein
MVATMTAYQVTAKRWRHGWELHIDGVGVTQSHGLKGAEAMVRDYIALDYGGEAAANAEIVIVPELPDKVRREVDEARREAARLARLQNEVAALSRQAATDLRDAGLSGADMAVVLGVSPQRVSQLINA